MDIDEKDGTKTPPSEPRHVTNAELELMADARGGTGQVRHIGYASLVLRRFFRQPSAVAGLVIFFLLVLLAVVGPFLSPYDYTEPDFAALSLPPFTDGHLFGTDGGGLDLFACVVHGLGRSLTIGVVYTVLTLSLIHISEPTRRS